MTEHPQTEVLVATRESLHRVAEHVLAAALKRATGQITLLARPGGFGTPDLPDGSALAVEGTRLVVTGSGATRSTALTTLAEAAAFAGTEPGFPWTKHPPATPFEPDLPMTIDEDAAGVLADWFALGQEALTALVAELADEDPSASQIFPEHFDLGVTAGPVNYGFSPGDDGIPEPYVYVGPHQLPVDGEFWNAPFGAYRTRSEVASGPAALEFLLAGHTALGL